MQLAESRGLILFSRDYKEKDKLVKIFTESAGKQMFYAKGIHKKNNPLTSVLQNFTEATFIMNLKADGLSFLNGAKDVKPLTTIQQDIFLAGYSTYLLNLADAAIEDKVYDPHLYQFLSLCLNLINDGYDAEIITNIFEVQILQRFGVAPIFDHCVICGKTTGRFDYSSKYGGVLCENHFSVDEHRYHADPNAMHFIRLFNQVDLTKVKTIKVKSVVKKEIRRVIDQLYDEYVGIHLKSKKFIDDMHKWQDLMKPDN